MNNQIINLLKEKNYVLPEYLLKNYKKIGMSSDQFIFIVYLINQEKPIICNYSMFSKYLNVDEKEILLMINELKENGILEVEVKKNSSSKLEEYINKFRFIL